MVELKESIHKKILKSLAILLTGKTLDDLISQKNDSLECLNVKIEGKDSGEIDF